MGMAEPSGCGADLAEVHHRDFGFLARHAAPVPVEALQAAGLSRGLVVDLGCGSGILAHHLTDAGYDVLGVDISAEMVRRLQRAPPRRVWIASLPVGLRRFARRQATEFCFLMFRRRKETVPRARWSGSAEKRGTRRGLAGWRPLLGRGFAPQSGAAHSYPPRSRAKRQAGGFFRFAVGPRGATLATWKSCC